MTTHTHKYAVLPSGHPVLAYDSRCVVCKDPNDAHKDDRGPYISTDDIPNYSLRRRSIKNKKK